MRIESIHWFGTHHGIFLQDSTFVPGRGCPPVGRAVNRHKSLVNPVVLTGREREGRESVQPDAADDDNCSSTFHFHFKPASLMMAITQDVSLIWLFSVWSSLFDSSLPTNLVRESQA